MKTKKLKTLQDLLLKLDEVVFVDLATKYAKRQTKTALGNGLNITTKNDKEQKTAEQWARKNKINKLANTILFHSKILGRLVISPTIKDNGELIFSVSYPFHENRVSQVLEEGVQAVVYKRPIQDDSKWLIKEVWDTMKVQRFWVDGQKTILTEGASAKVPYELKKLEFHNLGYLPVFEYLNFDIDQFHYGPKTMATDRELTFDADVKYLEDLFNLIMQVSFMESISTQTYLSFNVDPQTLAQLKNNSSGIKRLLLSKIAVATKKVDTKRESKIVEMIQGQFQAGNYTEMAVNVEKMYAEGVGSSFRAEGQAMATATEIVYTNSDDEKTANEDARKISEYFENMLSVIFGKDIDDPEQQFVIRVVGNKVMSDADALELSIRKHDAGIITKHQLIQEVLKLSEDDADAQVEKIEEEDDKNQERFMKISGGNPEPTIPGKEPEEDPEGSEDDD